MTIFDQFSQLDPIVIINYTVCSTEVLNKDLEKLREVKESEEDLPEDFPIPIHLLDDHVSLIEQLIKERTLTHLIKEG